MRQYSFQFLLFLLLALPLTAAAGEWVKLDGAKLKKGSYSDGDSFHVVHKGKEYVFRLFYVDTPETDKSYPDRVRGQAQYFSISAEEVIQVGVDAADFTQKFLKGTFTVYTDWSDGWGRGTRYRAIIQKDGVDLGSTLVSEGLARASGFVPDSPWPGYDGSVWDYRNYLNTLKDTAEKNGVGAWGKSRTKNSATTPSASATVEKSADGRIDS